MKRNRNLDYGQWAVVLAILACMVASVSRQSSHQLWQDIVIIISGIFIGAYGLLLAINWRELPIATARRYGA